MTSFFLILRIFFQSIFNIVCIQIFCCAIVCRVKWVRKIEEKWFQLSPKECLDARTTKATKFLHAKYIEKFFLSFLIRKACTNTFYTCHLSMQTAMYVLYNIQLHFILLDWDCVRFFLPWQYIQGKKSKKRIVRNHLYNANNQVYYGFYILNMTFYLYVHARCLTVYCTKIQSN